METPKDDCENVSSSLMTSLKISEDGTQKIEAKLKSAVGNVQTMASPSVVNAQDSDARLSAILSSKTPSSDVSDESDSADEPGRPHDLKASDVIGPGGVYMGTAEEETAAGTDRTLKFTLVGNNNVGKTAICKRFATHTFNGKYVQTSGVDFYRRRISLPKNSTAFLQLWDVGGNSLEAPDLLRMYLFEAHAILFIYDVANIQSFDNLTNWIAFAKNVSLTKEKPYYMCLIGNKIDAEQKRLIRVERHNKTAELNGLNTSFYVSAKTGDSIDLMFKKIAAEILGLPLPKAEVEAEVSIVQAQIPIEMIPYNNPSPKILSHNARTVSQGNLLPGRSTTSKSSSSYNSSPIRPAAGNKSAGKNGATSSAACEIQ